MAEAKMNKLNFVNVCGDTINMAVIRLSVKAERFLTEDEKHEFSDMKESDFRKFASSKGWVVKRLK